MKKCCEKQYLIWGETGYLTCSNCGAEDTGDDNEGEEHEDKLKR